VVSQFFKGREDQREERKIEEAWKNAGLVV
jgi:hypothetical protein